MNVIRPCLSCGLENESSSTTCSRCGAELRAHAAAPPSAALGPSVRSRGRGAGTVALALVAVAALLGGGWWWLAHRPQDPVTPALQWEEPLAVAAWGTEFLTRQDVPPEQLVAQVADSDSGPRRVLLAKHPEIQPLPLVLRGAARLLIAARSEGPESAAHLAVVQRAGATWTLPIGEAAGLAEDPSALARLLGVSESELGLPDVPAAAEDTLAAEGLAPSPPAPPASAPAPTAATVPSGATATGAGTPVASAPTGSAPAPASAPQVVLAPASAPVPASAVATPTPAVSALPARASRGNGPVPPRAVPGTTTTVFRIQIAAGARRRLTLSSLTLRANGTLPEVEDVAFVDLFRETDVSGRGATRPERLGERRSFADEDGALTFDGFQVPFGEDGLPLALSVAVELLPDVVGGQIELMIPAGESVVLEDSEGASVRVVGLPLKGPRISVDGNVEPDPEQSRLDALAEAGPDAVDPNVERMRQEAIDAARAAASDVKPKPSAPPPPR